MKQKRRVTAARLRQLSRARKEQHKQRQAMNARGYLTINQLTQALNVTRQTINNWEHQGLRPAQTQPIKYFSKAVVQQWLKNHYTPRFSFDIREKKA